MTQTKSSTSYLSLLEGLRQREDLLRIFIFTLVTVFFWIGFEIYLSQQRTKVPEDYQRYTLPLNPNIDRNALQEIESRRGFSDEDLQSFSVSIPVTEVPVEDESLIEVVEEIASDSAEPQSSSTPSPSSL